MDIDSHCNITEAMFGEEYTDVHQWIDSMYVQVRGYGHWIYYHHIEGISKKYKTNSVEYKVAILHVCCDYISHFGKFNRIPKDANDVRLLLRDERIEV